MSLSIVVKRLPECSEWCLPSPSDCPGSLPYSKESRRMGCAPIDFAYKKVEPLSKLVVEADKFCHLCARSYGNPGLSDPHSQVGSETLWTSHQRVRDYIPELTVYLEGL